MRLKRKSRMKTFGDLAIYFSGATDQVGSMTAGSLRLKPGMSPHPPHQHPEEEFMVITEGTGEIVVEGKTTKVAAGSMMYCAGGKTARDREYGREAAALLFLQVEGVRATREPPSTSHPGFYSERRKFKMSCFCDELSTNWNALVTLLASDPELS